MDTPSPPRVVAASDLLEKQLREIYGRVAYTHKTHEKMADASLRRYGWIKRIEIGLSAVSSSALVLAIFGDKPLGTIVGAVLSTILLALILYFKEEHLGQEAQKHTETASRLWAMREGLLSLLVDARCGAEVADVRARRDVINKELELIYKFAPRTDSKAYAAAQKALKESEELYFCDSELDRLLPKALRHA